MIYLTIHCPGSYGTYVAWSLYTYSELNTSREINLPFTPQGSCHLFRDQPGFLTFQAIHEHNFVIPESNIIRILPEKNRLIEYLDNQLQKQGDNNHYHILNIILSNYKEKILENWGSNNPKRWEERELLSFFLPKLFDTQFSYYRESVTENHKVIKIESVDIYQNFKQVIQNVLDFFSLKLIDTFEQFEKIHKKYLELQKNLDKGQLTLDYAEAAIAGKKFTFSNVTLLDEAWIQHLLREKGFEIKCYELNQFPVCASKLTLLLEKM